MQDTLNKINYLSEEQYQNAKANGSINESELYMTPDITNNDGSLGNITVDSISSKNLFNKYDKVFNAYIDAGSMKIVSGNTVDNEKLIYARIEPNETYTISKMAGASFRIGTTTNYPTIGETVNQTIVNHGASSITITTGSNDNYLVAYVYSSYDTVSFEQILNSIQVEKGDKATSYVPYKEYGYESGVNDYGSWKKYDDGTMECYGRFGMYLSINNPMPILNGTWYYAVLPRRNFPQIFTSVDYMDVNLEISTKGYGLFLMTTGESATLEKTNSALIVSPSLDENDHIIVNYRAIGRWK